MPSRTFRIATIRGIDVRMAPSWLLIAGLIVWSYQRSFGDRGVAVAVTMSIAVAVLFTLSVLLHELAHALEARHRGIEVGGITLFLLGGATALHDPDRRAADEFAVAGVGPWSNVVLAAAFGLLSIYADSWDLTAVAEVLGLLGWLNLGLAAFNLVPGAPLDGGRVLRAGVWAVTGNRHGSTVVAAWFGIALGAGLAAWALWLLGVQANVWAGVWLGLIGAYVLRAARSELARGRLAVWLTAFTAAQVAPPVEVDGEVDGEGGEVDGEVDGDVDSEGGQEDAGQPGRVSRELPTVAADASADVLVGLLDRDQPHVVLDDGEQRWTSSLQAIDDRIRELRRRQA